MCKENFQISRDDWHDWYLYGLEGIYWDNFFMEPNWGYKMVTSITWKKIDRFNGDVISTAKKETIVEFAEEVGREYGTGDHTILPDQIANRALQNIELLVISNIYTMWRNSMMT